MTEKIRTFWAIELSFDIKSALKKTQHTLKETGADIRWVNPQNLHLTLKFLGDIEPKMIPPVVDTCRKGLQEFTPFSFQVETLGAFPSLASPKVIWAGVTIGDTEIRKIVRIIEATLKPLNFLKEDRKFASHITLGRVTSALNRLALIKTIKSTRIPEGLIQTCQTITLFKSTLTSKGPVYEELSHLPLKPKDDIIPTA